MNITYLNKQDLYRLCRYLYKYGMSPLSDVDYDKLESEVKNYTMNDDSFTSLFGESNNPFETSYDDDTVRPDDLIDKCLTNDEKLRLKLMENSGDSIALDAYVSKSMHSERSIWACKPWIDKYYDAEFCISPKIDGINTTTEYVDGSIQISRTRGRGKNAIDIFNKMSKVLPSNINYPNRFIVAGEAVITRDDLTSYNEMGTGNDIFVTCRGSALSILRRTDIPDVCTSFVKIFVFRTNIGDTLSDGLDKAQQLGFNVVPHEVYKFKYTTDFEFEKELSALIWKYKGIMEKIGIPTDGLVLQINDNKFFGNTVTNTAYDGGNLAVKALAWEPGIYVSKVEEIVLECNVNYQYNCKVRVSPTYTEDGKKMQMVNLYNVNTLINNNIHEGDTIEFQYVNETTINFVRKV